MRLTYVSLLVTQLVPPLLHLQLMNFPQISDAAAGTRSQLLWMNYYYSQRGGKAMPVAFNDELF